MKRYMKRDPVISAHQFNGADDIKEIKRTGAGHYVVTYTSDPEQLVVRSNVGVQYEYVLCLGDWFVKVEGELPVVMFNEKFLSEYTEEK